MGGDITSRLRRALPPWFPGIVGDALIAGCAVALNQCLALLNYVRLQTLIKAATDGFLDLISLSYLGTNLPRRTSESDNSFRSRILANLILERATLRGMVLALTTLTGRAPKIFEPANATQAFTLGHSGLGTGQLGSYQMNNQALIVAYRATGGGGANVAGLGCSYAGLGGSYLAMVGTDSLYGAVRDADIFAAVDAAKPAGSVMWTAIQS